MDNRDTRDPLPEDDQLAWWLTHLETCHIPPALAYTIRRWEATFTRKPSKSERAHAEIPSPPG